MFDIIDSHCAGYVYLELRYLLTECVDDGKYNAVEYDRELYASNLHIGNYTIHGPAIYLAPFKNVSSVDGVQCIRCLVWPTQATDWP